MPTYSGKSPAIRPVGSSGQNHGTIGDSPVPIEAAVAPGQVALYSWISHPGQFPAFNTISGDEPEFHCTELVLSEYESIGQGWLTGNGVYEFKLGGYADSFSVDINPGSATYQPGT